MSGLDELYLGRLERLAAFLEALPPERFEFERWVGKDWGGKEDLSCGTTACALGWATTIPEFRELGLRLRLRSDGSGVVAMEYKNIEHGWDPAHDAAEKVFGLDFWQAEHLFVPGSSPGSLPRNATATQVAAHIRAFVEEQRQLTKISGILLVMLDAAM
jgi:hypothetical protein